MPNEQKMSLYVGYLKDTKRTSSNRKGKANENNKKNIETWIRIDLT